MYLYLKKWELLGRVRLGSRSLFGRFALSSGCGDCLDEMRLHESLQVEIVQVVGTSDLQESREGGIGMNNATVLLVSQLVGLDVGDHLLGGGSARHLSAGGLAQELGELIADQGGLGEARGLAVLVDLLGGLGLAGLLSSLLVSGDGLAKLLNGGLHGGPDSANLLKLGLQISQSGFRGNILRLLSNNHGLLNHRLSGLDGNFGSNGLGGLHGLSSLGGLGGLCGLGLANRSGSDNRGRNGGRSSGGSLFNFSTSDHFECELCWVIYLIISLFFKRFNALIVLSFFAKKDSRFSEPNKCFC